MFVLQLHHMHEKLMKYICVFTKKAMFYRLLVQNHRERLISELENCEDPVLALHLTVLAIFSILSQNMLHASGRQVPLIISHLKAQLKDEDFKLLQAYHGKVQ